MFHRGLNVVQPYILSRVLSQGILEVAAKTGIVGKMDIPRTEGRRGQCFLLPGSFKVDYRFPASGIHAIHFLFFPVSAYTVVVVPK